MAVATVPAATVTSEAQTTPAMAQSSLEVWKQQTVGDFFARCNWENLEIPAVEAAVPGQAVTLDYSLSVGQFFGAIAWDAKAAAAMPSAPASSAPSPAEPLAELPTLDGNSVTEELPELEEIADESHLDGGNVTLDDFLGSFSL